MLLKRLSNLATGINISPTNRTIPETLGKSPVVRECVVEDAVQIEPVSAIKFPSITEKTGNFVNPRGRRPSPRGKIAEVPDG